MLDVSIENNVAQVTLNRPEKHNTFDDVLIEELTKNFQQIDSDPTARVMVLAANGKSFSAGADLSWMKRMANYSYEENLADAEKLANMLKVLDSMRTPTIAKVQGAAFGGAVGLVSCCDIAIGSHNANFCLSEVKIGLIPATISPYVIAAMGERRARRYFLTAERFNAEEACSIGLLSEYCDHEELDSTVNKTVALLLKNSPQALSEAKRLVLDYRNQPMNAELIQNSSERIAKIRTSNEGQEGLSAFLEKRNPGWLVSWLADDEKIANEQKSKNRSTNEGEDNVQ